MIAGYHHKLTPDLAQDMNKARKEAEEFASGAYAQALAKGDSLPPDERQKIIEQVSRYTGLSKEIIDEADLRIDVRKFTHYLLNRPKSARRAAGRPLHRPRSERVAGHAVLRSHGICDRPPFTSVFNNYVRTELAIKTDMPYNVSAQGSSLGRGIGGSAIQGFPDTASALRQAIVKNPYLKVLVMEGYYDLATPYFAANYTIDHLNLPAKYRSKHFGLPLTNRATWFTWRAKA